MIKGAVFGDFGNIWTLSNNESFPGGQFKFEKFYKQIAIDAGFGIRLTPEEILQRLRKRPAAYRLRVPAETIGFRDGLKGYYAERLDCTCGDFLLRRSDGLRYT